MEVACFAVCLVWCSLVVGIALCADWLWVSCLLRLFAFCCDLLGRCGGVVVWWVLYFGMVFAIVVVGSLTGLLIVLWFTLLAFYFEFISGLVFRVCCLGAVLFCVCCLVCV